MKITSITNKKGGIGKTTTTSALASICALYSLRVLVVDLDPQCNSTSIFCRDSSGNPIDNQTSITDLLMMPQHLINKEIIMKCIYPTPYENIDLIPGNEELDEIADKILLQNAKLDQYNNIILPDSSQLLLTNSLRFLENDYDMVFIDNTPYFNLISKNALAASDNVLIPVENDGFNYMGLAKMLAKIYQIKGDLNKNLNIIGVFFTKVNKRTNLYRQLRELFKDDLGNTFLNTYIRQDNKVKESNTNMIPLPYFAPKTGASLDYMKLVEELCIIPEKFQKKLTNDIKKLA